MKTAADVETITEHYFEFSKEEVSSVARLWRLGVTYRKTETCPRIGNQKLKEEVFAVGPIHRENDSGISDQLSLRFRAKDKEYGFIEDSSANPGLPTDYNLIKKQAISLMRRELPDYVSRILPSE